VVEKGSVFNRCSLGVGRRVGCVHRSGRRRSPAATTTGNPEITVRELQYLLKPLTREDLIVEADGWRALLKDHIADTSAKQI
jgi:hypothetical protein